MDRFISADSAAARVTTAPEGQTPASVDFGAIPEVSALPCTGCGAAVPYEPILVLGRDIGRTLARYCSACETNQRVALAKREDEERQATINARIESTIWPELRATDIAHPDFNRPLWEAVRRWTPGPNAEWLGIIGPPGCSKTRVLALLAIRGLRAGQRVVWTSAVRLQTEVERIRSFDRRLSANAREHLLDCQLAPVLFLDDVGKNTWDDRGFERHFFELLDHRRNHRLPTLWTANIHPEGFSECISKINAGPIIGRMLDRTTLIDLFPDKP